MTALWAVRTAAEIEPAGETKSECYFSFPAEALFLPENPSFLVFSLHFEKNLDRHFSVCYTELVGESHFYKKIKKNVLTFTLGKSV